MYFNTCIKRRGIPKSDIFTVEYKVIPKNNPFGAYETRSRCNMLNKEEDKYDYFGEVEDVIVWKIANQSSSASRLVSFLSENLDGLCDVLKLILQQKQAGNKKWYAEGLAKTDKVWESKWITKALNRIISTLKQCKGLKYRKNTVDTSILKPDEIRYTPQSILSAKRANDQLYIH